MAKFLSYTTFSGEQGMVNSNSIDELLKAGEYTQVVIRRTNPVGEVEVIQFMIKESFDEVYKQLHPND